MIPDGYKFTKPKHTPYDCANCVYHKYGQDIKIQDYVNAGRENTEAKKIIGKTVSIEELKRMCKEIPEQKEILNMNLDPYMANKLMKTAQIAHKNIMDKKADMEARAEAERRKETEEKEAM